MQFTSIVFIIFYIIILALVRITPVPARRYVILAANLVFYLSAGPWGGLFLAGVAVLSYFAGIMAVRYRSCTHPERAIMCMSVGAILLLWIYHCTGAYYPVGLSFYTLMAVGYVADVISGRAEPVTDFIDYFLSLSFFPVIVSGPIEKISGLASQMAQIRQDGAGPQQADDKGEHFVCCFLMVLWGLLEKIAISDMAGLLVGRIFDDDSAHSWAAIAIATVIYAFQLYADFDGYSNIAFGCAGMLGLKIGHNFRQPYLAVNVADFWRRWHISLSGWLRDYIYIPLGGSRCSRLRKNINVIVTFAVSGLWHGTGLNYLVWGMLHGIYQVIGSRRKAEDMKPAGSLACIVITFVQVDLAWFFFRAGSLGNAVNMIVNACTGTGNAPAEVLGEFSGTGLRQIHFVYMITAFVMLIITDLARNRNSDLYGRYRKLHIVIRWICCYALMLWIIFAALSVMGMDVSRFIYGQF